MHQILPLKAHDNGRKIPARVTTDLFVLPFPLIQMKSAQEKAIVDVACGNIDALTFCSRYGISEPKISEEPVRLLMQATAARDAAKVELALLLGFHFDALADAMDVANTLVVQDWHKSHEDLVGLLQRWRNPASVAPLAEALRLKPALSYLEYDDYGSFYKKCLHALAAIGTEEAISRIREFVTADDPILRELAKHRLERFER